MQCKLCQHYTFEGHRGGYCALLGVIVQGSLVACPYGKDPFSEPCDSVPLLVDLPQADLSPLTQETPIDCPQHRLP